MYKTEEECAGAPGDCDPASTSRRDFNKNTCGTESLRPSEGTGGSAEVARARWTLLRQVLRQKQADSPDVKQVSVRRFATFDLFCRKPVKPDTSDDTDDQWVEYRSVRFPEFSALLRDNLGPLRVNEVLNSFDNTGNVCVWPSEEVMAHYCLQNRHIFKGAVCELGGGMTCLAGIMVAICADVTEVLLSDGNEKSIQNVRGVIERNKQAGLFGSANVSSRVVRWDCESTISSLENHFDVIMCADCLFLDQYRASLVDAIRRLLQPNGRALVFAPLRGETLRQFCRLAVQAGLCVSQSQRYDAHVWDIHQKMLKEGKDTYDENIHFPNLITLTKEPQSSSH
ncbi:calmodulin-lysine N-methyltransferase isoform X1 [Synchiropus splendidus]|uniref:calmodulin-lysine N-methyltransferase isoform X1 n=1 Tax=Synchiropus splendidus TaxID=270530 RepID=UPI00237EBFFF|nr:calmodulin-lysine N-methyltransferase isoform X1 [Synchiropus splendidus]